MGTLFISHCSDDTEIMDKIKATLDQIFEDTGNTVFCTYQNSILAGKDRGPFIAKKIRECDTLIAVITDCYLRSVICISELAAFWAKGGNVLPIIYNGDTGIAFINKLFGQDVIYVSARNNNSDDLVRWLENIHVPHDRAILAGCWLNASQSDPDHLIRDGLPYRPYIGSDTVYQDLIHYCMESGIKKIRHVPLSPEELRRDLSDKKEVYLIGTNNSSLLSANPSIFIEILMNGGDIYCIVANQDSEFLHDVAAIESRPSMFDNYDDYAAEVAREEKRLHDAFEMVKNHLRSIYRDAKTKCRTADRIGHLYFGCAFTLIRQTVIVGMDPDRNKLWAWLTVTMPPKRASSGTLSMEITEAMDDGDPDNRTLTENIKEYVQEITACAKQRGQIVEVTMKTDLPEYFQDTYDLKAAECEWRKYYKQALDNMHQHQTFPRELIEIAAQHPLLNGNRPDTVFQSRLDAGIALYEKIRHDGGSPVIYVPGDVHIPDQIALSEAGVRYILSTGRIPEEDVLGIEMNRRYKAEDGVYNSADECYVASRIFLEGDFCRLHCICGDGQSQRKQLFYWRFGVIPMIHTVPGDAFHDQFNEAFNAVPNIIFQDHDWQKPGSFQYDRTRRGRKPGFYVSDPE